MFALLQSHVLSYQLSVFIVFGGVVMGRIYRRGREGTYYLDFVDARGNASRPPDACSHS